MGTDEKDTNVVVADEPKKETVAEVKDHLTNGDVDDKEKELLRELTDLRKVLNECKQGKMLVSTKKFMKRLDGGYSSADMNQCTTEVAVDFYIKDGYFYATITDNGESSTAIAELRMMWNRVMKRSTEQNLKNEREDYNIVIDLFNASAEKGLMYTISFFQPMYLLFEDKVSIHAPA